MNNCIIINTQKDKIIIKISEKADQKEIEECLEKKVYELKKLYKNEKTPILVTGKILRNNEIESIQRIIKDFIDVDVSFDSPKRLGLYDIKRTYNKEISVSDTKYHKGALRSGQRIEYEGSVVIIGDVNDGAEIVAGDNIVVMGTLRGLAHAGAKGNKDAIITAISIETVQLRIANVIKEIPRDSVSNDFKSSYAYIGPENEIVLE